MWYIPLILTSRGQRRKDEEFKASLSYIEVLSQKKKEKENMRTMHSSVYLQPQLLEKSRNEDHKFKSSLGQ